MKKKRAFILALMLMLSLSACSKGENPDNSSLGTQDTNNGGLSTPSNSTGSPTDDFLKTITAETAEAKGVCGPDLTWYYQDNVLVIKGTGDMSSCRTVDIHDIWVKTVTSQFEDADGNSLYDKINWVIIGEGVTSIGENAFRGSAISKITLPNTLERIEKESFCECENLKEITIPESVTFIGIDSFRDCQMHSITFLGDIPENGEDMTKGLEMDGTIYYSSTTFDNWITENQDNFTYTYYNWVKK